METLRELLDAWRAEAEMLRGRYGDERGARLCEVHADELEARLIMHLDEELTLQEAATESGYSYQHLRALIAGGQLTNVGRKGAPRVRRRDLPRKPRSATQVTTPAPRLHVSRAESVGEAFAADVFAGIGGNRG